MCIDVAYNVERAGDGGGVYSSVLERSVLKVSFYWPISSESSGSVSISVDGEGGEN